MMAEHGKPCDPKDATYCMNGGTCYKLPTMDTLSCICSENYRGSRCEHYELPLSSLDEWDKGLVGAVVVIVILILVVLAVVIYYLHRILKERKRNRKNNDQQNDKKRPLVNP